jgi:hypothetical protein
MARARSLLLVLVVAGCAATPAPKKKDPAPPPPTPGPSALQRKLDEHRALQAELGNRQEAFIAADEMFELRKGAYLIALSAELARTRGAKPAAVKTIATMADERNAVATELVASRKAVSDALVERARAAEQMLAVEGRLWELEAEAFGGRTPAAARAEVEVRALRDAVTGLHVAQKGTQAALAALANREFEANATVGEDVHARDVADRQLADLRAEVDQRYAKMIEAARLYDDLSDRVHRRLLKDLPAGKQALAGQARALLDERTRAAAAISDARSRLKEAVLKRAELRAREMAHDGEIAALVEGAFKDAAIRDQFLLRVRDKRDEASAARVAAQNAEVALGDVRRRLATVEADITALGY